MQIHISRRTFIAFCFASSVLAELRLFTCVNSQRLINAGQKVSSTNEVLYLTEQFLSAQVDYETSQLSYTIKGDGAVSAPQVNSAEAIHRHVNGLLCITSAGVIQQDNITNHEKQIRTKNEFSKRVLIVRDESSFRVTYRVPIRITVTVLNWCFS